MFVGRKTEVAILKDAYQADGSQFIAVYGRRRIGKTYMIRETFDYHFFFTHTGLAGGSAKRQIEAFCLSLKEQGYPIQEKVTDWMNAFSCLKTKIMASDEKKKVIFLDELSWMAGKRSTDFLSALESFWNGWASGRKDILLIVSSSATSWLLDHVIHNKGGLYHRLNHSIHLSGFSLKECKEYSDRLDFGFTKQQILELYMAFGGIPYYWSLLRRGDSVSQNIDRLCFARNGELHQEFQYLYASMFNRPEEYVSIITSLAQKRKGLTRKEIITYSKIKDTGSLSKKLEELEECGFIREYLPFGKKKKESIFQLIDNFTLFHFQMMLPKKDDEHFYQNNLQSGNCNAYLGLSFEMVCLEHIRQIKQALGISGVLSKEYSWFCLPDKDKGIQGHQIDLLIDRADGVINMCEMKYTLTEYAITLNEEENYRKRIADFISVTKERRPIIYTMITPYGILKNSHSGIVSKSLTLDDLMSV